MNNKTGGKSRFGLGICFVSVVLCFVASFLVSDVSVFYDHLQSFSHGVRDYDRDTADKELENLKNDYNVFSAWKLQYFADRFLFDKMYRYEAAVSILSDDFEKAEKEDLKDKKDDYYASYMLGIAKFNALHSAFQQAMAQKDKKQMVAILNLVLEQVRPDFERCVKEGPGSDKNFNCSYDYDLTSDPKAALKALMSQKPKPKYVLGLPEDGKEKNPNGKEPGKKELPKLNSDEKREAGKGGAKKVG